MTCSARSLFVSWCTCVLPRGLSLCLIAALCGCGTTKFYDGPVRPDSQLAHIVGLGQSNAHIMLLDGKTMPSFYYGLSILPGRHTLVMRYWLRSEVIGREADVTTYLVTIQHARLEFEAEAGARYTLGSSPDPETGQTYGWLRRSSSGEEFRAAPMPTAGIEATTTGGKQCGNCGSPAPAGASHGDWCRKCGVLWSSASIHHTID